MKLLLALLIVALGVLALNGLLLFLRHRRRAAALALPAGQVVRRRAQKLPTRIFVDKDVAGGPSARGVNHGAAHMVLTDSVFVVATWHGRIVELSASSEGTARYAGPRRLVVEGPHPSGRSRVRAEILVDDAQGWARAITRLVQGGAPAAELPDGEPTPF